MTPADVLAMWRRDSARCIQDVFDLELDAWQVNVCRDFDTSPRIAMKACKGPGKALSKSAPVLTLHGWTKWGSLKAGDAVYAPDGSPTKILAVHERGARQMYRVTFSDGSSTRCCGEHLWRVQGRTERRHGVWVEQTTEQLIERGVILHKAKQFSLPHHAPVQTPYVDVPLHPYLLGVWIGDGCRSLPTYGKPYPEVRERIVSHGYTVKHYDGTINNRIMGEMRNFRALGDLFHCGSHERYIPEQYKLGSITQRRELLWGLMDTDGCIGANKKGIEYNTTSKRLAEDVAELVRSLGGLARMRKPKQGRYRNNDGDMVECRLCYRVSICTPFNPFTMPHKRDRWSEPNPRYLTRYIASIEPDGVEDCSCITVDHPSHCYLVERSYIVTHNSFLKACLTWSYLLTRRNSVGCAVSISGSNLRDGLWSELARLRNRSEIIQRAFVWRKTVIESTESPETWWFSARTFPRSADADSQASTLAGLHNDQFDNAVLIALDEAGDMPVGLLAAADAIMANGGDARVMAGGNPTSTAGALYHACVKQRQHWAVTEITSDPEDPDRTPRVSVKWAQDTIDMWGGRDSPYVQVNILGQFPSRAFNALFGLKDVERAYGAHLDETVYQHAPKVLGIDVAGEGDDRTVMMPRQGLATFNPIVLRGALPEEIATRAAQAAQKWKPDIITIDNTGGWAQGVRLAMRQMGISVIPVGFAEKATNPTAYLNRRAEMYWLASQWLKDGGVLPPVGDIIEELTVQTYTYNRDRIQIEPKDKIKEKLGRSPDLADALALTFAVPTPPTRAAMAAGHQVTKAKVS